MDLDSSSVGFVYLALGLVIGCLIGYYLRGFLSARKRDRRRRSDMPAR